MKITKNEYEALSRKIDDLEKKINGGKGSGNFGHAGRPGKQGGSASESSKYPRNLEEAKKARAEAEEKYLTYLREHPFTDDYDQSVVDKLGKALDDAKWWQESYQREETYKKSEDLQAQKFSYDPNTGEYKNNDIQFAGDGEPKDIVVFPYSEDAYGNRLADATGCLKQYGQGEIEVGYGMYVERPFVPDYDSKNHYQDLEGKRKAINEKYNQNSDELSAIVKSAKDKDGRTLWSTATTSEIATSNLSDTLKKRAIALKEENSKLHDESMQLLKEIGDVRRNAQYTPTMGVKSALIMSGLSKGVGEYLGQRSDGAGEGSFSDRVKYDVNAKCTAYTKLDSALRNPMSVTEDNFKQIVSDASKLAASQASYLKRVETSIKDPNFLGSKEFANTAQTIKNLTRQSVIVDKNQTRNYPQYVSFKDGTPTINYDKDLN